MTVAGAEAHQRALPPAQATGAQAAADRPAEADFTFDDLIDVINPLHHLPVVSTIYRAITGDQISVHARAIGGGVYGGPAGILIAGATMAAEEAFDLSADKMLASLFTGDGDRPQAAAATDVAALPSPAPTAPTARAAVAAAASPPPAPAAEAPEPKPAPAAAGDPAPLPFTARKNIRFFELPQNARATLPLAPDGAGAPTLAPPPDAPSQTRPAARAEAAAAMTAPKLSAAQSALLEKFVAGAQTKDRSSPATVAPRLPAEFVAAHSAIVSGSPERHGAGARSVPAIPEGATADWIAARMQANLQKYAAAQAAAERERRRNGE